MKRKRFTLPVGFADYRVTLTIRKPVVEGERVQGCCNSKDKTIDVYLNPDIDVTRSTLWHEFVHAICHELGADDADNEGFVEGFAQAIMRVRKDIPWM